MPVPGNREALFDGIHFHIRRAMTDTMPLHWIMFPRTIFDHELIFVEEGKVCFQLEGSDYIAEKNNVILVPPGKIHSFKTLGSTRWKQPHIHFDMEADKDREEAYIPFRIIGKEEDDYRLMREDCFGKLNLPPVMRFSTPVFCEKIKNLVYQIIELQSSHDPCDILRAKNHLTEIFILIIKESQPDIELYQDKYERVYQIANLMIEQQLNNFFDLEQIAEKLNYTPNYISAIYKKHFGITPAKMYEKMKMTRAKEYVSQEKITITEIAAALGYISVNDFSRAFKRYFKCSPMQYRKNNL